MKTAICYFTGTGNSLYAAQVIARRLGECDLFRVADCLHGMQELERYDRVGLCFPVYGFGMPGLVSDWIDGLDVEWGSKHFFAVLTCGGLPGDCATRVRERFAQNGLALRYVDTVTMPDNFSIAVPAPGERAIAASLDIAERRLLVIAADLECGLRKAPRLALKLPRAASRIFMSDGEGRDRKFILTAACTGCGQCAELCPADNIRMEEGRPVFLHRCELCLGCFHRCPEGAINYGRRTIKKRRYVNPRTDFKEKQ